MSIFETLNQINVNDKTEVKDNGKTKLTYLSWAWAFSEVKKIYPNVQYEVKKFENNLPYVYDEKTGYMVFTSVTIDDLTHEMWLPVMDGNNKAMKSEPYDYTTKYGTKTVEAATMFDINKAIMRCLAKNLGMFGLGLYIYAGEDLPEVEQNEKENAKKPVNESKTQNDTYITLTQKNELRELLGGVEFAKLANSTGGKISLDKYNEIVEKYNKKEVENE